MGVCMMDFINDDLKELLIALLISSVTLIFTYPALIFYEFLAAPLILIGSYLISHWDDTKVDENSPGPKM